MTRYSMTRHKRISCIAGALLVMTMTTAEAHHSAAQFDFQAPVDVTGTVRSIRVENPHMRLVLAVSDGKKAERDIEFEGHSLNNFYRAGWRPNMIKEGDKISVNIAPRKDGEDGGYVRMIKTADGKLLTLNTTTP